MSGFFAIIHKEQGSDYGVSFPDIPGCISAGETLEEAKDMASEALALHIDGMRQDDEVIPKASDLSQVSASDEYKKDTHAIIFIEPANLKPKQVRVNISVDENILKEADSLAEQNGLTRSGLISMLVASHSSSPQLQNSLHEKKSLFLKPKKK